MITKVKALKFVMNWLQAWNSHDLEKILSHYSEDIQFTSPQVITLHKRPSGMLTGKKDLSEYFQLRLETIPDLRLELQHITLGVNSIALVYKNTTGLICTETMIFNDQNEVVQAIAHYE